MAKIYNLKDITKNDFIKISDILKKGGLIIYPTETIYGIGCNALDKEAMGKLYKVKKRSVDKKTILLFKNCYSIKNHVEIISRKEEELMERYWPGKLTIILKEKNSNSTIACRISPHPFLEKLFKYINFPLSSTSANIAENPYTGEIDKIISIFKNKVDVIINAGNMSQSQPSTIVKVVNNEIVVVRQGDVNISEL